MIGRIVKSRAAEARSGKSFANGMVSAAEFEYAEGHTDFIRRILH
jgi:hypothetical protein